MAEELQNVLGKKKKTTMASLFGKTCGGVDMKNTCVAVATEVSSGVHELEFRYCDDDGQEATCEFKCSTDTDCQISGNDDPKVKNLTISNISDPTLQLVVLKCRGSSGPGGVTPMQRCSAAVTDDEALTHAPSGPACTMW